MQIDTTVNLFSSEKKLTLKNPIMTASGTFGNGKEFEPYGDITSLGGIFVKGISLEPRAGNPLPRIAETSSGMLNAVGLQNNGVEYFLKHILPTLPYENLPIFANIYATSVEDYSELASILDSVEGIAGLEVNVSCPNVKEGGVLFGQDAKLCAKVTEAVKKAAKRLPVIVKLTPNVTSIAQIAKAAELAGADALSLINTVSGMAINVKTRKPLLANIIGGLSGPAIKPVALRCLYETRKAVNVPLIGMGGIVNATDVLEFLLLGASAIQVGTANFTDPSRVFMLVEELKQELNSLGYSSVEEFSKDYYGKE